MSANNFLLRESKARGAVRLNRTVRSYRDFCDAPDLIAPFVLYRRFWCYNRSMDNANHFIS